MAMIAVSASKAADLIEERDGYAPSPWRSVPWLHQRSCYDGSAQGTEVLVSMATTAVAASKERLARIVNLVRHFVSMAIIAVAASKAGHAGSHR